MEQKKDLTSTELKRAVLARLPIWLLTCVIAGALTLTAHYFTKDRAVITAVVNFSYDGIESGRDPTGSRFDETEIKNEDLLREAANAVGINLPESDVEKLQRAVEVRGNVPESAFENIVEYESIYGEDGISNNENMRETSYFPSQYAVTFYYAEAGFSVGEGIAFTQALLSAYEQYFYEKYGYNTSIEQSIFAIDYKAYDYINSIDVLGNRLLSLRAYLLNLASQDNTRFSSVNTGYSFSDLVDAVDTIRNEDIEWLTSYIISNNITKNRDDLIDYYQYRIEDAQRELAQRESRLYTLNELIENYVKTNAIFLGIADSGEAQENAPVENYQFSQKSKKYDSLIREKVSCQTAITATEEKISLYQSRMEKLIDNASVGDPAVVDEGLERINSRVIQFLSDTHETADEYFKTVWLKHAFQVLEQPQKQPFSLLVLSLLKECLPNILIISLIFFAFFLFRSLQSAYGAKRRERLPEEEKPSVAETPQDMTAYEKGAV